MDPDERLRSAWLRFGHILDDDGNELPIGLANAFDGNRHLVACMYTRHRHLGRGVRTHSRLDGDAPAGRL